MAKVPKASGGDRRSEEFKKDNAVRFETKAEVIEKAGFTPKQVQRFETLADNPELVEQAKAEARENDITRKGECRLYTLCVACQKGGTGKSTSALAIGAELNKAGYRVLFVDCDAQSNLTKSELTKPFSSGLYDVLTNKKIKATDGVCESRNGHILPSDVRMAQGGKLSPLYGSEPEYRIKTLLQGISAAYDVAVIDTAPQLGELTIAALTASDGVIVPARADRFSLNGLQDFHDTFLTIRKATNSKLRLLGVVITQYSARSTLTKDVADAIRQQARLFSTKMYEPPIRYTVNASAWQYTGYTYGSTAQKDYQAITKQLISDMKLKGR